MVTGGSNSKRLEKSTEVIRNGTYLSEKGRQSQ